MKKKTNRLLSILLCCVMLIGLLPTTAFAWTAPTLSGDGGGTWNIQLSAEGVLSWNDQQGATSYTIEVDKTAMGSTLTRIENINATSYNLIDRFKELKVENGTYYFQIKANGLDTTSNTISFKYVSPQDKLSAPQNLSWDGTTAKWDSVANATGYTVILYTSSGSVQLNKTTTETQYNWDTEAADGRWFEVVATADNYRDSNAAEGPRYGTYSWTAPTLSGEYAAWNVQLSDAGVLSWDDKSATSYDIEVDETEMGSTVTNISGIPTNSYNLIDRFKELKIENGTYYFTIKANGPDTNSGTISFRYVSPEDKLSAPQNLCWDGTVAKWDSVTGATEYNIKLISDSGYVQLSKTTTETQYDWTTYAADGYWFEVVATADNYRDSNTAESPKYGTPSEPTTYTVTYDANGGTGTMGTENLTVDGGFAKTYTFPQCGFTAPAGQEFDKWQWYYNDNPSQTTDTTPGNSPWLSGSITVKALWKDIATYTVTYDPNGGTGTMGTEYLAVADDGFAKTYTFPQCGFTAPVGQEFDKWQWYYNSNPSQTTDIAPGNSPWLSGSITVKALWKAAATYTVTFDGNGGGGSMDAVNNVSGEYTLPACTFTAPSGQQFKTWSVGGNEKAVGETITVTANTTVTAVWEDIPETTYGINCVTHNLSGSGTAGTVSVVTNKGSQDGTSAFGSATENTSVTVTATPAAGYEFVGWRKSAPADAGATVSTNATYVFDATETVWLYAVFQETPPVVGGFGGFIDFLTTDNNVCFAETDESGFMRVNLFGNGKAMKLPLVYRTDNLDLKFDGWYTAKEGGEKVTEDTVFNGYTILYDRWTPANIGSGKIINSIMIPNSALVNGYTEIEYINASSAVSLEGVVNSKVYAVYNGLNAYGSQVTGEETIDTSKDYSVVTTVKLEDGYYFAPNISLTAQHGVRAGVTYRAIVDGVGVTTNTWNNLATTVDICINFPAGGNNVGFTTEPVGGTVNENEPYNFTWGVSGQPTAAELQVKSGNDWATADTLTVGNTTGTIAAQTGTKTYRILVTYGNSGSIYCNEFTVTWLAAVQNTFSMSPASGTVKNGTDYYYTWACVQTPATANLERKNGNSWDDLGTATSRTITYDNSYADTTQTFRIKATMAGGNPFYSDEFTVTYKATPLFAVQPGNGKVAVGSNYTVNYTVQTSAGDGEFDGNNSVLQKKNGGNWENVSTSVYFTEAVVPAQQSETTGTYRVGIKIGSNELLYSEEFTVQWVDDYTFELDKDSLAWGSVAKSDGYNEYAKMIKVMPTGTVAYTDDTLKYDTPSNFDVYKWKSPSGYYTLTFTPKSSLAAGTYNENISIWATSNGSDQLEKKTVNLSITIEAPTYTVSFDKNGGSGSMASIYNVSGSYELPTCTFTAPANKEFKAWQVNGGAEMNPGESITVTGNTVLTALWKDILVVPTYTVSFEANGGTGTMADVTGVSGNYTLPACGFTAPASMKFKNWLVGGVARAVGDTITVTANTTVTAQWEAVETWTVYVSSQNVCGVSGNYNTTQYVEQGQAMTDIIVTANDGYYFPEPLSVTGGGYGVTVTRNSYTQVTISGTPTAGVSIQFGPNAKTKEDKPTSITFEATDSDKGNLTNLENGVTYSVTGAATAEFAATGDTYALTNVVPGTLNIVKKATDTNTKLDSDAHTYPVGKNNSVPNVFSTNCTDANNNNGQIKYVTAEMEYQKEGDNAWTPGTGNNITGLTPGTYYVRYKASSINLASDPKTINIAAYNAPALTGTVTITGTAKFGELLTADVSGITNNTGTLSYQWVRNSSNISGATGENYTLVEADIGNTIKVVVTSSVESGSITSDATAIVEKADGPVAPTGLAGVAPTTDGGSDGKITGTATTMEYSTDSSFTNPTGTLCPDTETTGLTAGTYYVRVKETTTHKAGANATVVVPAYSAAPIYSISLDATGTHTFTAATVGYAAQTAKTVTVSNTGNSATGALTVALSGNNASSFTLSKTSIADIAASGSDTFTVVPKTGLSAGTYTATVTVSGSNSITASVNVSFTVNSAGGNGGGGGGGGVSTYAITVESAKNGSVSVNPKAASKGATITVTVDPDKGYALETLTVTDKSGKEIEVTAKNGKYTFTMPASKVVVKATFMEDNTMLNHFVDVFATDYYYDAVLWAVEQGITGGTSATTFSPDADCTRAQMATFLWRAAGSPDPVGSTNPFDDVSADAYYAKAAQWAYEQGITGGTSATTFSPDAACTRAQMVTFLHRVAGTPEPVDSTNPFTDVPDAYYTEAVQWAYEEGITGGTSATTFSPNVPCTRGQMVTFLYRFFVK